MHLFSKYWLQAQVFKIPASGTGFQNTGFLPASAKLAVKYQPGQCNTSHQATLIVDHI